MEIIEQLKTGLAAAQQVPPLTPSSDSKIVICGMGGSIMPAEALSMLWIDELSVYINRTAYLPHWANPKHTVICISWSGHTEETIACFEEAYRKNIPVYIITAGGKLAELAKEKNIPTVFLTHKDHNSRNALGLMLSALLTLLSQTAIINHSVNSSLFNPLEIEALANSLASKIGSKTPLIYSSYPWRFLGLFWKIFFNENTKIHAFSNYLPGAGHNEIAGIKEQDKNFFYLVLKDQDDHSSNLKKAEQFTKFLEESQTENTIINISGPNRFEKILQQYLLASATSIQLAKQLGVDPQSTEVIEKFKHLS